MSKAKPGTKKRAKITAITEARRSPAMSAHQLVSWILGLSRWKRIALVALLTLAVSLFGVLLVNDIYLRYFFDWETYVLPSLFAVGIGILFYVLGWWLLVGTVGTTLPARQGVLWYVGIGLVALIMIVLILFSGYSTATMPTF
jgi:hypothetical protein